MSSLLPPTVAMSRTVLRYFRRPKLETLLRLLISVFQGPILLIHTASTAGSMPLLNTAHTSSILAIFRILYVCTAWNPSIIRGSTLQVGVLLVLAISNLGGYLCAADAVAIIMGSTCFIVSTLILRILAALKYTLNTPSSILQVWFILRWASEIFSAGNSTAWRHCKYSVLTVRVRYCSYCE